MTDRETIVIGTSPFRRIAAAIVIAAALLPVRAGLASADTGADAEAAIRAWVDDIRSGDRDRLAASLAPEFQVLRSDGRGYGKDEYVAGGTARIAGLQDVSDVVATREGALLVVRYMLNVTQTIDGRSVQAKAPRLTVFRREGDRWLVVAHANFARID